MRWNPTAPKSTRGRANKKPGSPPPPPPEKKKDRAPEQGPAEESPTTPVKDDFIGKTFGHFKIERRIGSGGMSSVYAASHTEIGGSYAVKLLNAKHSTQQESIQRFLREAKTAAKVRHPNIVKIMHAGESEGVVFVAMEYIEGRDLDRILKEDGPFDWSRLGGIGMQICRGLEAAHRADVIHRDIKPSNCIRDASVEYADHIRIIDFGIAKGSSKRSADSLTDEGTLIGTPEYMAPELARGDDPNPLIDIYAVGVTLYKLLTGRLPFTGKTFADVLYKQMHEQPVPPSRVAPGLEISPAVDTLILKALSKRPEDRFQSMQEMARAIDKSLVTDFDMKKTIPRASSLSARSLARIKNNQAVADSTPEVTSADSAQTTRNEHTSQSNNTIAPTSEEPKPDSLPVATNEPATLNYLLKRVAVAIFVAGFFVVMAAVAAPRVEEESVSVTPTVSPGKSLELTSTSRESDNGSTGAADASTQADSGSESSSGEVPVSSPLARPFDDKERARIRGKLLGYRKKLKPCNALSMRGLLKVEFSIAATGEIVHFDFPEIDGFNSKSTMIQCFEQKLDKHVGFGPHRSPAKITVVYKF